jgi:AmmeMemoRadiSam system protein B
VTGAGVREPAVAGRFYPAEPDQLAATVDALLASVRADVAVPPRDCVAAGGLRTLVVPHAGYVYSGPVAARGYSLLTPPEPAPDRVVLLGPSHYVPLRGMACSTAARWRTPLGEIEVEQAPGVTADEQPHSRDHALEVQLPFLQRVIRGRFVIVPVAVGPTAPTQVADLLDRLETMHGLVVVSTDLSHYHDAATAARLDRRTAGAILARDVEAIGTADACGAHALRGMLEHCRRHNRPVTMLDLRTSADTAGNPSRVVGYGTFAAATRAARRHASLR